MLEVGIEVGTEGTSMLGHEARVDGEGRHARSLRITADAAGTPPSTFRMLPVSLLVRPEAKKQIASATSSGVMFFLSVVRLR